MQLSSRILTALAVLILAVTVVAVRAGSNQTVDAATGVIDVLNVGTCYTTDDEVFTVSACKDGEVDDTDGDGTTGNNDDTDSAYNVAGRTTISEVENLYATYAIDPKTSGDQPRAILKYSDVIKISISDKGRDKRTGKLYAVDTADATLTTAQRTVIQNTLKKLADDLKTDLTDDNTDNPLINLTKVPSDSANRFAQQSPNTTGVIGTSGDAEFNLSDDEFPMAPKDDGKVYWFGTVTDTNPDPDTTIYANLTGTYITLDEDVSSGRKNQVAPWMRVTASIPSGVSIEVHHIYYQTSEEEVLVGGANVDTYDGTGDNPAKSVLPVLVDDENNDKKAKLSVMVGSDGVAPSQNLWLQEKSRFSGVYEGYVRLTDANGDRIDPNDNNTLDAGEGNWGVEVKDATGAGMADEEIAVLGVESGPVKISYRNSKGDVKTLSIAIDKSAPSIQVDSPVNGTSSTDDSPELIGTFSDGGGSGLRKNSFKVYADNHPDSETDATPVWDLGVLGAIATDDATTRVDRGRVCVDADSDDACDADAANLVLRSQYHGYNQGAGTFGIIHSKDIYLDDKADNKGTGDTDGVGDGETDYKTADAETYEDGDTNGEFDTIVRIDFPPANQQNRYNHTIDIQAVVLDIAGNIGFSDAEPSDPTFIHDLGTAKKDRDADDKHNVLGWYSRHVYYLDDVDPYFKPEESATGFFVDGNGDKAVNNNGLMVDFDNKLDPATVGIGTFDVTLDDGTSATVLDAAVNKDKVFLLIEEMLAPNATPKVELATGQAISDLAGNESTARRLDGIELKDGILPTLTVTLSGGSGLNEDIDGEGPSELTKEQIKISISSNEALQGPPQFAVVCSNLYWGDDDNATDDMKDNNVGKFVSNRTKALTTNGLKGAAPSTDETHGKQVVDGDDDDRTMCPDHTADASGSNPTTYFDVAHTNALRRAGNNWEYLWSELTGDQAVEEGKLSVIVWGRDRSSYKSGPKAADALLYNYSAVSVNFNYDKTLKAAWDANAVNGELVPGKNEEVFEVRPFVLLDFGDEKTTVDVTMFDVDGTDYTSELQILDDNEFVWWPDPLSYGTYKIKVEANDAANNTGEQSYSFEVKERAPFVLNLLAGWNSISFPATPVDRALHAVFTDAAIDQVVGWDITEPVSPWRMATRVDGVWTTNEDFQSLTDVEGRYGYWVHSTGFITQAVALTGKGDRGSDGQPSPADIPTDEGWNFVGVVDVDGDQTQDDAGETLRNSNNDPITAAEYLGNYTRAYTWDHINNTWDVLKKDEGMVIGTGVWVYYTKGHDIAP